MNGFKALVNSNFPVLRALIDKHKPALLCLQEIKLQSDAVDDYRLVNLNIFNYNFIPLIETINFSKGYIT